MKNVFFRGLVLLALLAVTLAVIAQEEDETIARTGFRLDAPTYGIRGEYPVGTMVMILSNEERPLPMTVWYPALNPDGLEEVHTYPISYPPVFTDLEAYGHALFEAAPDVSNGPYPLVVFSHGFTGHRTSVIHMMEHLASWGFVVIAPDHIGMTASEVLNEPDTFYPVYYTNPTDVSLVIDFAENMATEGPFAGMIDTEHIASTGHSAGGFAALQAVGGQLDLAGLAVLCEETYIGNDCDLAVPFQEEIARIYGLDTAPDGLFPSLADDRIDVVIPMAPDQRIFGKKGLNNVMVPTLYIVGNQDQAIPFADFEEGFASLGSETAWMVVFDYAGHGLVQDTCENFPAMIAFGLFDMCAEKVWDKLRAHDLMNHYVTAFLLWQLNGDEEAAAVFGDTPDAFPGVEVIVK
ncbi:MAG: alpha/beta fold hydrolase [Anaerolineaceae bacterium]|nr:alpha/beta fold hydrolase [Anaerolineaceae bacterium]